MSNRRHRPLAPLVIAVTLLACTTATPAASQATTPLLRIPFPADAGPLTPYAFGNAYPLLSLIYDTLAWRDRTGRAQPGLASSIEPSPDGSHVTIRLAAGAAWHDGLPVTAADVAFTFRYVAKRQSSRFTPEVSAVKRVDTPEPTTAVVTLGHPSPGFVDQTLTDLPILPAHLWEHLSPNESAPPGLAVGSGPYRLSEHTANGYRLVANPSYFRGPPSVARLDVPFIPNLEETLQAFESRRVDVIPQRLAPVDVIRLNDLGTRVARGPGLLGIQLTFNLRRPPFSALAARSAVASTVDLRRLSGAIGDVTPADHGLLHPASRWSPPEILHTSDGASAAADLAKVSLPALEVLVGDDDPTKQEGARQVALALQRAGVAARAKAVRPAELDRMLGVDGSDPTFDLAVTDIPAAASLDPELVGHLFGSATPSARRTSGYANPEFDRLAGQAATAPDPKARMDATTQELRLLAADLPVLPLCFPNDSYVFHPSAYDGWQQVPGAGILDKQSFLTPRRTESTPASLDERPPDPLPFLAIELALGVIFLVLGASWLVSRRRRPTKPG